MRVDAGQRRHVATDGTEINVDQQLSVEQVDFLLQLIRHNNRCPNCVTAVEVTEGGWSIEPHDPDHLNWFQRCKDIHPLEAS